MVCYQCHPNLCSCGPKQVSKSGNTCYTCSSLPCHCSKAKYVVDQNPYALNVCSDVKDIIIKECQVPKVCKCTVKVKVPHNPTCTTCCSIPCVCECISTSVCGNIGNKCGGNCKNDKCTIIPIKVKFPGIYNDCGCGCNGSGSCSDKKTNCECCVAYRERKVIVKKEPTCKKTGPKCDPSAGKRNLLNVCNKVNRIQKLCCCSSC